MGDDLVKRLHALAWQREQEGNYTDQSLVWNAADAIERLTRERADLITLWASDECFINDGRVIANFSHYGADAEPIPKDEIGRVAGLVRRYGPEAVVSWICFRRGLDNPIKGVFTIRQRAALAALRGENDRS